MVVVGGGEWGVLEKMVLLYHSNSLSVFFSSLVLPILQSKTLPVRTTFSTESLEYFSVPKVKNLPDSNTFHLISVIFFNVSSVH